ncbi:hypothetical protein N658DRAFT_67392 [Parathielavia hyrcaniae]|uniref:G-protein coupled receptors family 2 profile 2 domain-containing protein n=1 Tax=Parathielavia hyrcaniae TaxID=113614 RepID=A0AAN6Q1S5_9PEZI|nr:hypothetical protein N658DRAFT_67392 [Parathielavia hyrcaniae]
MGGMSEDDIQSVVAIERTCSALSFLGCCFVLATFCLSDAFRQRAVNRLVFLATFGNLMTNVATLMTTSYTHSPDSPACQTQALLIQVFMQGDAYWALAMAINVYLTFYRKYDARQLRKMEIPYFLCCYGIPFIPGITFVFVTNEQGNRPYGDASLWCWLTSEWEVYRIATFYGPIWVAILISGGIYAFVWGEVRRARRRLLHFSSNTGNGTAVGAEQVPPAQDSEFSPAFNFKTTEVTQTTEIIPAPAPTAKPPSSSPVSHGLKPGYSVAISADHSEAADNELHIRQSREDVEPPSDIHLKTVTSASTTNSSTTKRIRILPTTTTTTTTQVPIAPTVTATVTTNAQATAHMNSATAARRRNFESSATLAYSKCAILFFSVLLITWIPSSGNRVYSLVNGGEVSRPLFFASAFVLPLQGFWNAIIYVYTSWAACRSLWRYCAAGLAGWRDWAAVRRLLGWWPGRRESVIEILDQRGGGMARGASVRASNASKVGIWVGGGRKDNGRESDGSSMENLTREGRAERVSPV